MPKLIKEAKSHTNDGYNDFTEWNNTFFKENLPKDYTLLLRRDVMSLEERMNSYKIQNETKYKITRTGVHEAKVANYGLKFKFVFYVEVEVGNEKVQSGWANLVYGQPKSPDDACYALWDKDGNLIGGGRCDRYDGNVAGLSRPMYGTQDRTKRTYSFSLSYYVNPAAHDNESVEKEITKLEKMDKIAKITLVPWSKYLQISKDLKKGE